MGRNNVLHGSRSWKSGWQGVSVLYYDSLTTTYIAQTTISILSIWFQNLKSSSTWFHPCFPLRRAYLLLYCWVSKPIPLYLKQAFELLWSNHLYVDTSNHIFYVSLFSTKDFIWMNMTLKGINDCKEIVMIEACKFCYISSDIKTLLKR